MGTAALSTSVGDELFQSPQFGMMRQLCLVAMRSVEHDILKPAMIFLQKLAMSRTNWAAGQQMDEVMTVVLLHFHTWPRHVSGQSFKLFQAFLERHEAAFLALAVSPSVPCMQNLPPTEQAIAHHAIRTLRGPRLKAFLGDLAAISRGDATLDMLHGYAP